MIYRIKGVDIHAENAAQSHLNASKDVIEWISKQRVDKCLDYGCGKLRYFKHLRKVCERLTVVDSPIQLHRKQNVLGVSTSVCRYLRERYPEVRIVEIDQLKRDDYKYDLIFCANVLSAIPCKNTRHQVILKMKSSLTRKGKCIFINQFRNSYFTNALNSNMTQKHYDGFIIKKGNKGSFYGLIPREILVKQLLKCGYSIIRSWICDQKAFVLAGN